MRSKLFGMCAASWRQSVRRGELEANRQPQAPRKASEHETLQEEQGSLGST